MENQNFGFVFIDTRKNPIVETKNLNFLAAELKKRQWFRNYVNQDKTGFNINPVDAKWEYEIQFNEKSCFVVFRELDKTTLECWFYSHTDDLKPIIIDLRNYQNNNYCVGIVFDLLKKLYNN